MATLKYATRLNTFINEGPRSVEDALREVAKVDRIRHVDLNYPEHFGDRAPAEVKALLDECGLAINSVAMRFRKDFIGGEFSNADEDTRRQAIELTKQGIDAAAELGCNLLTLWLGFDGYDYTFQSDYAQSIRKVVEAVQELADYRPEMRISIEYKPYEERAYALIPNAGVTLHVINEIDRPNVGATLDFCHQLMAGEMPAFAASLLLERGKLWGIHLNDGNGRFDDGLMVGSVHIFETYELLYYLARHGYDGVVYFDTFPIRESAVAEATTNAATLDLLMEGIEAVGVDQITDIVHSADGVRTQQLRTSLITTRK